MTIDHLLQCGDESVNKFAIIKSQLCRKQISITFLCGEMVEQHAFLQGGQGIDILDINRTVRNSLQRPIDGRLFQGHQRQHVRRDDPGIVGNKIGRDLELGTRPIERCRQVSEGLRTEQGAHISLQTGLSKTADQLHCKEGCLLYTSDAADE